MTWSTNTLSLEEIVKALQLNTVSSNNYVIQRYRISNTRYLIVNVLLFSLNWGLYHSQKVVSIYIYIHGLVENCISTMSLYHGKAGSVANRYLWVVSTAVDTDLQVFKEYPPIFTIFIYRNIYRW